MDNFITKRAKFARVCIEVDLSKTLVSKSELNNREYRVEYERLQHICFRYGCYGHSSDQCSKGNSGGQQGTVHDCEGQGQGKQGADFGSWTQDQEIFGP